MLARKAINRVFIPSDTILTPLVLVGAIRKLPTSEIENAVDALICELDRRCPDPDIELEADEESDEFEFKDFDPGQRTR